MRTTSPVSGPAAKGSKARTKHDCAACGMPMADSLSRLGSIRCHDCRDIDAPLCSRRHVTTGRHEPPRTV
jgi:DNA-directed RNA polymerase subunit RPC12/RpoP